MERNNL